MLTKNEPYADIVYTAGELITGARDTGGHTCDRYGNRPEAQGWAVGGACVGFSAPIEAASRDAATAPGGLVDKVALWIQAQPSNVQFFGSWADSGRVYFDGVSIVATLSEAMDMLRARDEDAAFNLADGTLIRRQAAA